MKPERWYDMELRDIPAPTRDLLESYSKIAPGEVNDHVVAVREKAWAIFPYPCIGQWRFLELSLGHHDLYPEVLQRMKTGNETLLDLGCCFGQDIRRLVADGVDSANCYGCDLQQPFMELGYDLFRDRNWLKSSFIEADIFDEASRLSTLDGKVDIVVASSFFHLFGYEQQKMVAHRVARLLRQESNSLLVGRMVGAEHPHETERQGGGLMYRHNVDSWRRLWDEVGEEVGGLRFQTEGRLVQWQSTERKNATGDSPGPVMRLMFSVRRL
ncbi:hypothetical protein MBLNU230_g7749t1 [Neophaeotheca triangularis]